MDEGGAILRNPCRAACRAGLDGGRNQVGPGHGSRGYPTTACTDEHRAAADAEALGVGKIVILAIIERRL